MNNMQRLSTTFPIHAGAYSIFDQQTFSKQMLQLLGLEFANVPKYLHHLSLLRKYLPSYLQVNLYDQKLARIKPLSWSPSLSSYQGVRIEKKPLNNWAPPTYCLFFMLISPLIHDHMPTNFHLRKIVVSQVHWPNENKHSSFYQRLVNCPPPLQFAINDNSLTN